jgi:hypothetical protein
MNITFDKLFSYWVFAWFIFYYISVHYKIFPFILPSPIIGLYVGFIENLFVFFILIQSKVNTVEYAKYMLQILITKGIPLYLLGKLPVKIPQDIYSFLIIFSIYLLYLQYNETNVISVYKETEKSIIEGKNETPLYKFIDSIYKYYINK